MPPGSGAKLGLFRSDGAWQRLQSGRTDEAMSLSDKTLGRTQQAENRQMIYLWRRTTGSCLLQEARNLHSYEIVTQFN